LPLTLADGLAHFDEQTVEVVELPGDERVLVNRVAGDRVQLRLVDVLTDADGDQVDVVTASGDGLEPRVTRGVGATVGDNDADIGHVLLVTCLATWNGMRDE